MIKHIWALIKTFLIASFLTLVTQVGGLIYLVLKLLSYFIKKKTKGWKGLFIRLSIYAGLYLFVSLFIIPRLAQEYNRVPLPYFSSKELPLKPASLFFCLANRHYVRTELYANITKVSNKVARQYPGTELHYLDANFPLFRYFPLLPHKSHNDGRRLDISFLYKDSKGKRITGSPGVLGYGYCETPRKGEVNWPEKCRKKGYRLYSMLFHLTKYFHNDRFLFDEEANRFLLQEIAKQKRIRKIFIEPHLKTRMRLQNLGKIRFHGCGAVRHDDHVHMEI